MSLFAAAVHERLRANTNPDDCWLWCLHCERFFRAHSLCVGNLGERDACPFADCAGVGLGFVIFIWDDFREPSDPRWPRSTAELEHGMRSPDMGVFYGQETLRQS
jgi:hypothetical protein